MSHAFSRDFIVSFVRFWQQLRPRLLSMKLEPSRFQAAVGALFAFLRRRTKCKRQFRSPELTSGSAVAGFY